MYALVYWSDEKTKSIVDKNAVPADASVNETVLVQYRDGNEYKATILAFSEDKRYLQSLTVSAAGEIETPKKHRAKKKNVLKPRTSKTIVAQSKDRKRKLEEEILAKPLLRAPSVASDEIHEEIIEPTSEKGCTLGASSDEEVKGENPLSWTMSMERIPKPRKKKRNSSQYVAIPLSTAETSRRSTKEKRKSTKRQIEIPSLLHSSFFDSNGREKAEYGDDQADGVGKANGLEQDMGYGFTASSGGNGILTTLDHPTAYILLILCLPSDKADPKARQSLSDCTIPTSKANKRNVSQYVSIPLGNGETVINNKKKHIEIKDRRDDRRFDDSQSDSSTDHKKRKSSVESNIGLTLKEFEKSSSNKSSKAERNIKRYKNDSVGGENIFSLKFRQPPSSTITSGAYSRSRKLDLSAASMIAADDDENLIQSGYMIDDEVKHTEETNSPNVSDTYQREYVGKWKRDRGNKLRQEGTYSTVETSGIETSDNKKLLDAPNAEGPVAAGASSEAMFTEILRLLNETTKRLDDHDKLLRSYCPCTSSSKQNTGSTSFTSTPVGSSPTSPEKVTRPFSPTSRVHARHNVHARKRQQQDGDRGVPKAAYTTQTSGAPPGMDELKPGSGVYIDSIDLKFLRRYKNNPAETARRLMKALVGVEELVHMTARGTREKKGIPKKILDAVKHYIDHNCRPRLHEVDYIRALNQQISNLRNPKPSTKKVASKSDDEESE